MLTDVSSKINATAVNVSITPSSLPTPAPDSPRDPRDDEDSEDDENEPPLPIPGHRVSYCYIRKQLKFNSDLFLSLLLIL